MSRWQRPVRVALVALVLLSFAAGGVRLADPLPRSPERRAIDAGESPASIAHDAMLQSETGNYVVELRTGNESARRTYATVRVDTADRQYRARYFYGHARPTWEGYGDESGTWTRPVSNGSPTGPWDHEDPVQIGIYQYRNEDAVRRPGADVSVVERGEGRLVLRVDDTDTAMLLGNGVENATADDPSYRASLTLVVDRRRGVLRRSVLRWSRLEGPEGNRTRRTEVIVRRYRRWGEVDVERPAGLPSGFDAVLYDLLNHGSREADG